MKGLHVTVGQQNADIIGNDNRALQAAVDYISTLGGGTVEILPGTYTMHNSLHLRSNITVVGHGTETTLWKADGVETTLELDGDFGEEQITVENTDGFQVGYGVSITDNRNGGFHTAVGTLLWQDENTFGVNVPMGGDYLVSNNARAATTFPVISGYHLENARVENLTVDGNKDNNPHLNGCRGAGIFLYRGHHTTIEQCTVKNYHGDGISFQQSQHVTVNDCTVLNNTHLGLHPGSGSQHPTIRNCRSENNGRIGLYLCWRVKYGIFENNDLISNGETGISIGHKDTDNTFTHNRSLCNGREGLLFRKESEPMGGHRNTFDQNQFVDNGNETEGYGIRILGETHDLTFNNNRIGNEETQSQRVGVHIGEQADNIHLNDNDLTGNLEAEVVDARATVPV